MLAVASLSASTRAETVPDVAVTSALVYNVAKLTTWPEATLAAPDAPFVLCLLRESSAYGGMFAAITGKPVKDRPLQLRPEVRPAQLPDCQALYLDEDDEPRLHSVLHALRQQPVLTIGAYEGFAHVGGMVALFVEDGRMRFQINRHAVSAAGLQISSQLQRMADLVDGDAP